MWNRNQNPDDAVFMTGYLSWFFHPERSKSIGGGMGERFPPDRNSWGCLPGIAIKKNLNICQNFKISKYFQNKVCVFRREIGIWG